MMTVDGIGEHSHKEDVNRTDLSSESTDRPCGEHPMSMLGARGYPEWRQNLVQWHIR